MEKRVKGFAIVNTDTEIDEPYTIWGTHGIGVGPMCIFSDKVGAEFFMNQDEHKNEVARGTTKIIECEVILYAPISNK